MNVTQIIYDMEAAVDPSSIFPWLMGGGVVLTILSVLLTVVCTVAPIAGIGWFLIQRSRKARAMQQASQAWASTTGQIVKSRVEVTPSSDGANVNPVVIYEYEVYGQRYQGNQIRAGGHFITVMAPGEPYDIVDRYPMGATVTVYYDPANPALSALER